MTARRKQYAISAKLSADNYEVITEYCVEHKMSRTDLVLAALDLYLNGPESKERETS